jgi:hypothetical protein
VEYIGADGIKNGHTVLKLQQFKEKISFFGFREGARSGIAPYPAPRVWVKFSQHFSLLFDKIYSIMD